MGVRIINSFKKIFLLLFISISLVSANSYADAICNDCWRSTSEGRGTCSWHGGIKESKPDGTYLFSGYRPWGCGSKSKKDNGEKVWYRYVPLMDSPAARIFRKIF
jgi:hypothetical protein